MRRGVPAVIGAAFLAMGAQAAAQNSQIEVSPLPNLPDTTDPGQLGGGADLPNFGDQNFGEPGQLEGDFSIFNNGQALEPSMGLESTGVPNREDFGFVQDQILDENGVIIQVDPDGQAGVALIQAPNPRADEEAVVVRAANGQVAELRALDKTLAQPSDFTMRAGEVVAFGRLVIRMQECRYPVDNPASDAFAHLQIADREGRLLFDGWMIASSPALMALEHSRYDVWVLGCRAS